jgi:hypothetical protein
VLIIETCYSQKRLSILPEAFLVSGDVHVLRLLFFGSRIPHPLSHSYRYCYETSNHPHGSMSTKLKDVFAAQRSLVIETLESLEIMPRELYPIIVSYLGEVHLLSLTRDGRLHIHNAHALKHVQTFPLLALDAHSHVEVSASCLVNEGHSLLMATTLGYSGK